MESFKNWGLNYSQKEERDTSGVGIVPGRMGPTAERVVWKRLEGRRIAPVRPTATHRCSKEKQKWGEGGVKRPQWEVQLVGGRTHQTTRSRASPCLS